MTREKLQELRQRMLNHKVVNDTAMVELTAKELDELLNLAEEGADALERGGYSIEDANLNRP
jgi:hypothetical protein